MLMIKDDTDECICPTISDLEFWSISSLAHSLRIHVRKHLLPWYVAGMLPIVYSWPRMSTKQQLIPDLFVSFVPDHPRTSYDPEEEGSFPPFVLDVVSEPSKAYEESDKRLAYEALGAQEYALFTPREGGRSTLRGYRRLAQGNFAEWPLDEQGRLWSDVLNLYLVINGRILQAETTEGQRLLSPEETNAAWHQAELARQEEARGREEETQARQQIEDDLRRAEAEVQRLRHEIDRLRGGQ